VPSHDMISNYSKIYYL